MPYFTDGVGGPNQDAVSLDDFRSSMLSSVRAAASDAWDSNPSSLLIDWLEFDRANNGEKLDKTTAEQQVKQSGVKLDVPADGYTQEALDILIKRRQREVERQDVLARAPTGFVPGTARLTAQLAAGIADPIGVAASVIPVVGEARVASLLANTTGFIGRTVARAGIGAVEGTAGQAILEPALYGLHSQLQDDYKMSDVLLNLAFGGALGAVTHGAGGAVGDFLHTGPRPEERFRGLSTDDVKTVLNFEREAVAMTPEDRFRAIETFSPEIRRAIGEQSGATPAVWLLQSPEGYRSPLTAAAKVNAASPEIRNAAMQAALADFVQGRIPDVEHVINADPAPQDLSALVDEAIAGLQAEKASLLGTAGNLANKDVILETRQQLKEHLSQLPKTSDEQLRSRAKEMQVGGVSYEAALFRAKKEADGLMADHQSTTERLRQTIASNADAQKATQRVSELDKQIADLSAARAVPVARSTFDDIRATAQRQSTPEGVSIADFFAARETEQRLKEVPQGDAVSAIKHELSDATDRLSATVENLRHGGFDEKKLSAATDTLKPFDDAVADSENLARAVQAAALCNLRT